MSCWYYIGFAAAFLAGFILGTLAACHVMRMKEDNEDF